MYVNGNDQIRSSLKDSPRWLGSGFYFLCALVSQARFWCFCLIVIQSLSYNGKWIALHECKYSIAAREGAYGELMYGCCDDSRR